MLKLVYKDVCINSDTDYYPDQPIGKAIYRHNNWYDLLSEWVYENDVLTGAY